MLLVLTHSGKIWQAGQLSLDVAAESHVVPAAMVVVAVLIEAIR